MLRNNVGAPKLSFPPQKIDIGSGGGEVSKRDGPIVAETAMLKGSREISSPSMSHRNVNSLKSHAIIKNFDCKLSTLDSREVPESANKTVAATVKHKNSSYHSKVSLPVSKFQRNLIDAELQVRRDSTPMDQPGSLIHRGMIELEEDGSRADEISPEDSIEIANNMRVIPGNISGGDLVRKRSTVFGRLRLTKDARGRHRDQTQRSLMADDPLPTGESFRIQLE